MEKGNGFFIKIGALPKQESQKCPFCDDGFRVPKPALSWATDFGDRCSNRQCLLNQGGREKRNKVGEADAWKK